MRICDSWCEHIECNEIRKKCMHPIGNRSFLDWNVDASDKLTIFGQCQLCKLYVPLKIKRNPQYTKLVNKMEKQS
ncbi:MAG: hypothetical protein D4R96_03390 [Nitrosopumilaceae archaeon]|nr:MAG: hypothetical protein D4R96_03390 [Nitrosopumilaceae archaeon]